MKSFSSNSPKKKVGCSINFFIKLDFYVRLQPGKMFQIWIFNQVWPRLIEIDQVDRILWLTFYWERNFALIELLDKVLVDMSL